MLADLDRHNCLAISSDGSKRGWTFLGKGKSVTLKVGGNMECNDGAVLHALALASKGLAWRSMREVGAQIASGEPCTVLDEFAAPGNDVYAVFAQRQPLPHGSALSSIFCGEAILKQNIGESDDAFPPNKRACFKILAV